MKVISRSANAVSSAAEVSGDGGTGRGSGMTSVISQSFRTPRAVSESCSISAHSLGAGGHLNGAPHTPITTRPSENVGTISAQHAPRRATV